MRAHQWSGECGRFMRICGMVVEEIAAKKRQRADEQMTSS